jgi:hypothetical protein
MPAIKSFQRFTLVAAGISRIQLILSVLYLSCGVTPVGVAAFTNFFPN